ncbi:hypothetical protein FQN54_005146 [Arachnomyces sp. PD_36]|nr:hypothetical protein FQN54_005146 [Arachnomyces sp. PD_36]
MAAIVDRRHIQDEAAAESQIPHWGYPSQVVPCTNDQGTCEYLDGVYWMHDVSMLYTFIMWAVIGGLLIIFIGLSFIDPRRTGSSKGEVEVEGQKGGKGSTFSRAWGAAFATCRHHLLPESAWVSIFGHVTRLQVLILAAILGYLLIFSLIGIVYKTWVTPIEGSNLHNVRTGLGGFSDRIGALAYALTPLTVALSTRDNMLSILTGIPYQHFNFLHRWTGRIIFVQSFLHTLSWTIIEGNLYKPQPQIFVDWIKQLYMVFGIIAQILITFLYLFSIKRVVQWTGHEFFRKTHYVAGILYLGACWGHWDKLACWMIASIGILFLDRGCRLLRIGLIHLGFKDGSKGIGFKAAQASMESYADGDGGTVIRLDFTHRHPPWKAGQHFFLCFPELHIWQSHPFTPASTPRLISTSASSKNQAQDSAEQRHVYIIRCLGGETSRLPSLLASKRKEKEATAGDNQHITTPVILTGPFGLGTLDTGAENILAVAGGTGISFSLPIMMEVIQRNKEQQRDRKRVVELAWVMRRGRNVEWSLPELEDILGQEVEGLDLRVRIFITRDGDSETDVPVRVSGDKGEEKEVSITQDVSSTSSLSTPCKATSLSLAHSNVQITRLNNSHPSMNELVSDFIQRTSTTGGRTQVVGSGPEGMGRDLREAVAGVNDGGAVWRGEGGEVRFEWDNRYM